MDGKGERFGGTKMSSLDEPTPEFSKRSPIPSRFEWVDWDEVKTRLSWVNFIISPIVILFFFYLAWGVPPGSILPVFQYLYTFITGIFVLLWLMSFMWIRGDGL